MKKIIISILILCILLLITISIFKNSNNIVEVVDDKLISQQETIDKKINSYINSNKYNINNPKIILNPYKISPLSALIIFKTKNNTSYKIYINNKYMTTTVTSKTHSIPIYGLIAGTNNKIVLKSNNTTKKYYIKTKKSKYKLKVQTNKTPNNNSYYFISSPLKAGYLAFNPKGQLTFKLNTKALDLEFLSNNHILVSNNEITGDSESSGMYEVDYLGKIYKKYTLKYSYHHEVNELSNGNLMLIGIDKSTKISDGIIFTIDKNTGKYISKISIYDIISNIDKNFADSISNKNSFLNSLYLKNNELILSLRGYDSVMSINTKTHNINWILSDKNNWPKTFNKYLLKPLDNTKPPRGQHTAFITPDSNIGLFNNDYSLSSPHTDLASYKNNYSSATIYKIDKSNMTYKTIFNYIDKDHKFNYAMGSFSEYNGNKLIDFGWTFNDNAYKNNLNIYNYQGNIYSRLVELDKNNNIIFRGTFGENTYRLYKHTMYPKETNNFKVVNTKLIDTTPITKLKHIKTNTIKNKLKTSNDPLYNIDITRKSIIIDNEFDKTQKVNILFVKGKDTYILNYKNKVNLNLKGKYKVYIRVDNEYYKTENIVNFK